MRDREKRMEELEAKSGSHSQWPKSSTYSEARIPGGSTEIKPFPSRRNNAVLSTLPCGTPSKR